jgi:hypothetical protein
MSNAVCVQCGSRKDGAFTPCTGCGLDPAGHRELQGKSVLLSHPHSSEQELAEASRRLAAKQPVRYDPQRLASIEQELRTQQTPLLAPVKGGLVPIVWVPVLIAVLVLAVVLYAFFSS